MLAPSCFKERKKKMSKIVNTGFAYGSVLPLCAKDENGVIDREATVKNIRDAFDKFPYVSETIPAEERSNVLAQIVGAAQSYGVDL